MIQNPTPRENIDWYGDFGPAGVRVNSRRWGGCGCPTPYECRHLEPNRAHPFPPESDPDIQAALVAWWTSVHAPDEISSVPIVWRIVMHICAWSIVWIPLLALILTVLGVE
jgi:hypothetical protein